MGESQSTLAPPTPTLPHNGGEGEYIEFIAESKTCRYQCPRGERAKDDARSGTRGDLPWKSSGPAFAKTSNAGFDITALDSARAAVEAV